jgi:hypothetical protein
VCELKSLNAMVSVFLIFLPAMSMMSYVSAQAVSAQFISVSALPNIGCVPIYVQATFYTYGIQTVWVGLSFKDMSGQVTDVHPQQVSVVSADGYSGEGMATFVVSLGDLPTSDTDIIMSSLQNHNLQYTVALWQGYDGSQMFGFLARWGWALVGSC